MMSLFSSFDLFYFYFTSYILTMIFFSYLSLVYVKSSFFIFSTKIYLSLGSFYYSLKSKNFNKMTILIIYFLVTTIFFFNFFSVFPFNFAFTSQFGMVFFASFMFWSSLILFNTLANSKGLISHFIPEGTPLYLVIFLFFIELISSLIRPLTLTVRLVANILAGHLLMILLSKLVLGNFFMLPFYAILNLIEMFVAIIQAYIFTTMVALYFSEIH